MLISRGVSLYRSILSSSPDIDGNGKCLREWLEYEKTVGTATASGSLDSHAASAIFMIVSNVSAVAASREALEQECEDVMSTLTQKVQNLGVTGDHRKPHVFVSYAKLTSTDMISKRRSNYDDSDRHRTSKRSCRPTTTKYLPTPSPPPSSPNKSLKPSSNTTTKFAQPPAPDPVRQYFLTHLSSPYPTPTEKEKLCKKAKITRRKLESDLTNWRRRSDWTDIMNTYCGGDKGSMKTMISVIECGEERDVELLARFGRMKAYLEKRDEQAGEWVYQVCPEAKCRRHWASFISLSCDCECGRMLMNSWQKWSNQVDSMKCDSSKSTKTTLIPTPTPDPIQRENKKTQKVNQRMDTEAIPLPL